MSSCSSQDEWMNAQNAIHLTGPWVAMIFIALMVLGVGFFVAEPARATADGPDHFAVRDVASSDHLHVRERPSASSRIVGTIAWDGNGIANLGCNYGTMENPNPNPWCEIWHFGTQGFVSARYLKEGSAPHELPGARHIATRPSHGLPFEGHWIGDLKYCPADPSEGAPGVEYRLEKTVGYEWHCINDAVSWHEGDKWLFEASCEDEGVPSKRYWMFQVATPDVLISEPGDYVMHRCRYPDPSSN